MKHVAAILILASSMNASAMGQAELDISDLWWNPAESGWGMNVVQQGDTSFVTMFVYGSDNAPTWFVASSVAHAGYDPATKEHVHSGALYKANGPAFSAPTFDPRAVGLRQVGQLTLRVALAANASTAQFVGRLTYSVDGAVVNKNVVKNTWRTKNHAGEFHGAMRTSRTGCPSASDNGDSVEYGKFSVTQGTSLAIKFTKHDATMSCGVAGQYSQDGRSGMIGLGAYACTYANGAVDTGMMMATDITSGSTAFVATVSAYRIHSTCLDTIRIVGAR